MSRRELLFRTRSYLSPEFVLAVLMGTFLLPICGVGVLRQDLRALHRSGRLLGGILGAIFLEILLARRNYVLDLLFRSVGNFQGRVTLGEALPQATRASARRWRLRGGGEEFLLLEGGPSPGELCRGEVSFRYLERSRLIVEVKSFTK